MRVKAAVTGSPVEATVASATRAATAGWRTADTRSVITGTA